MQGMRMETVIRVTVAGSIGISRDPHFQVIGFIFMVPAGTIGTYEEGGNIGIPAGFWIADSCGFP